MMFVSEATDAAQYALLNNSSRAKHTTGHISNI